MKNGPIVAKLQGPNTALSNSPNPTSLLFSLQVCNSPPLPPPPVPCPPNCSRRCGHHRPTLARAPGVPPSSIPDPAPGQRRSATALDGKRSVRAIVCAAARLVAAPSGPRSCRRSEGKFPLPVPSSHFQILHQAAALGVSDAAAYALQPSIP